MRANLRKLVLNLIVVAVLSGTAQAADTRLIVRDVLGLNALQLVCTLLGCHATSLGDPAGQVFLVTAPATVTNLLNRLLNTVGVVNVEVDQLLNMSQPAQPSAPPGLYDRTPVNFYGTQVWNGYANQPAALIIRAPEARNSYQVDGAGIVAIIDTGVDSTHPILKPVLVPGYDFTRNQAGYGDEKA